jgi:hypothetical protein
MRKNIFIYLLCILFFIIISFTCGYYYAIKSTNGSPSIDDTNIISDSLPIRYIKTTGNKHLQNVPLVSNKFLAVKIALAVLEDKYGSDIYEEIPFRVMETDSIWVVETSIPQDEGETMDDEANTQQLHLVVGGVGHVEIDKFTGTIYRAYHTK